MTFASVKRLTELKCSSSKFVADSSIGECISVVEYSHEFEFIQWLREHCVNREDVVIGIGDDAAVVENEPDGKLLLCTDTLMEGVHFSQETAEPRQIGRKSLAVNLSDIAAMGGVPRNALVSVCVPKGSSSILNELFSGLIKLAEEFGVSLVGGDTNSWDGPLVISVTVTGVTQNQKLVTRAEAKPGDWILVSGTLGGSLVGKHLDFTPRVNLAQKILKHSNINAMIDISDGLVNDLRHIQDESNVGAELWVENIPISDAANRLNDHRSPLEHALYDGEDFELLFTMQDSQAEQLIAEWSDQVPISHIGHIVETTGLQLHNFDGTTEPLFNQGWKHKF